MELIDVAKYVFNKEHKGLSSLLLIILGIIISGIGKSLSNFFNGIASKLTESGEIMGEKFNDWLKKK